jgi:hypothetical protein
VHVAYNNGIRDDVELGAEHLVFASPPSEFWEKY